VQVVLIDRADAASAAGGSPSSGNTRGGGEVDCDVLLPATGITVNSGFIRPHLAAALDQQGRIKVVWSHATPLHVVQPPTAGTQC
jgi:hypothetical protein